jgi:hypothetical protein
MPTVADKTPTRSGFRGASYRLSYSRCRWPQVTTQATPATVPETVQQVLAARQCDVDARRQRRETAPELAVLCRSTAPNSSSTGSKYSAICAPRLRRTIRSW